MPCSTRQIVKVKISGISKWLMFEALKRMKRNPKWNSDKTIISFDGGNYNSEKKELRLDDPSDEGLEKLIKKYVTLVAVQLNAPKFGWKVTVNEKSPWKFTLTPRSYVSQGTGSRYGGSYSGWW